MFTFNHNLDPREVIVTIIGLIVTIVFAYKGFTIPSGEHHIVFAVLSGAGTFFYVIMAKSFGSF